MLNNSQKYDELLYMLDFLSKKRRELISSFVDKNYEWIGQSFKYETNQAAFNLVRERFFTLWVDNHFIQLFKDDVDENVCRKLFVLLSLLLNQEQSTIEESIIKHNLLATKIEIIQKLLNHEDESTNKLNELKYSYEKDKALFEREFKRLEISGS